MTLYGPIILIHVRGGKVDEVAYTASSCATLVLNHDTGEYEYPTHMSRSGDELNADLDRFSFDPNRFKSTSAPSAPSESTLTREQLRELARVEREKLQQLTSDRASGAARIITAARAQLLDELADRLQLLDKLGIRLHDEPEQQKVSTHD